MNAIDDSEPWVSEEPSFNDREFDIEEEDDNDFDKPMDRGSLRDLARLKSIQKARTAAEVLTEVLSSFTNKNDILLAQPFLDDANAFLEATQGNPEIENVRFCTIL